MKERDMAQRYLEHPVGAGFGQGRGRWLRRWLVSQFARPRGFWGRVAGWIMAHRPSNIERNLWSVELLEIRPEHRVLELGCGPGIAIQAICARLTTGSVTGVDHSALMVRQAARRNAAQVAAGRVHLMHGQLSDLPPQSGPFDRMLAVNVAMFWDDPVAHMRELRQRLAPGGRLALTLQPRSPKATDEDARRAGDLLAQQLRQAGFDRVRVELRLMRPVAAVCVLAEG